MSGTTTVYKVHCRCGAAIESDARGFGRPRLCASCKAPVKIVWTRAAGEGVKTPFLLRAGAPSPFKVPAAAQEVVCPCGQPLIARESQRGRPVRCPVCARPLRLEEQRDPNGTTSHLRALDATPSKGTRIVKGVRPGEDLLCLCGESLRVSAEHIGRRAQCPRCGAVVRLEAERDPQTGLTRVRPKFVSKPDEKPDWSLEDFS